MTEDTNPPPQQVPGRLSWFLASRLPVQNLDPVLLVGLAEDADGSAVLDALLRVELLLGFARALLDLEAHVAGVQVKPARMRLALALLAHAVRQGVTAATTTAAGAGDAAVDAAVRSSTAVGCRCRRC